MIRAFFLSVRQLGDRRIMAVFLKSILLTLAIFAVLGASLWFGIDQLVAQVIGRNEDTAGWAALATIIVMLLSLWVLFRAIAVAVIDVFGDDVVLAVEAKHYPDALATARPVPFGRSLAMGLGSAWRTILINLLLSPIYLILLVTGVGTALIFFLVNAWLLARDLGDMVAARHVPRAELAKWRSRNTVGRLALGAASAGLFIVPVLNILAPLLSAAMATHMFHRSRRA